MLNLQISTVLDIGDEKSTSVRDYFYHCESLVYYSDSDTVDTEFGEKLLMKCGPNLKRFKFYNSYFESVSMITKRDFKLEFSSKFKYIEKFQSVWLDLSTTYVLEHNTRGIACNLRELTLNEFWNEKRISKVIESCPKVERLTMSLTDRIKKMELVVHSLESADCRQTITFIRFYQVRANLIHWIPKIMAIFPNLSKVEVDLCRNSYHGRPDFGDNGMYANQIEQMSRTVQIKFEIIYTYTYSKSYDDLSTSTTDYRFC